MIKVVNGNVLDCTEDVIIHQVNVAGVMGRWSCKATRQPL